MNLLYMQTYNIPPRYILANYTIKICIKSIVLQKNVRTLNWGIFTYCTLIGGSNTMKINERFCVSKFGIRNCYSIKWGMFKVLTLKEARLIELEFQGQIWLIQNLKCIFIYNRDAGGIRLLVKIYPKLHLVNSF